MALRKTDHPLVITSSRFKITLPIIVQAASSVGLKRGSGLVSPVAINCLAASGSFV